MITKTSLNFRTEHREVEGNDVLPDTLYLQDTLVDSKYLLIDIFLPLDTVMQLFDGDNFYYARE